MRFKNIEKLVIPRSYSDKGMCCCCSLSTRKIVVDSTLVQDAISPKTRATLPLGQE